MHNAAVARLLTAIADRLEAHGENRFKIQAYRVAAQSVDTLDEDIADVHREGRLHEVPGVGDAIAEKIRQYLDTGRLDYYDKLKKGLPAEFENMVQVEGLGPKRVKALHDALGIRTMKDLEDAALKGKIAKVSGFGVKSQEKILQGLGTLENQDRVPHAEAKKQADALLRELRKHQDVVRIEAAGSLRRKKKTIGDIDLVAAVTQASVVARYFSKLKTVKSVIAYGPTKVSVRLQSGRQADLRLVKPEEFGAAWLYFTGSKAHNIELRKIAQDRGWKLNEYGLFGPDNEILAQKTEKEVYAKLGFGWIPPTRREQAGWMKAYATIQPNSAAKRSQQRTEMH